MADTKLTGLTATTTPALTDYGYIVTTPGGTPASHYATLDTLQQLLLPKHTADGRLTLLSATPVTTADQTAKTTLYYTPYVGTKIGLYDGATWHVRTFAELSITLASLTASRPYDVWCYDNSGTPTLELLTWSSATARGTALAYQDGVLVKTGAATRRYLGTICITGSTGQCEDSLVNRLVWNYYNRVNRPMMKQDVTNHNYTTGAFQPWNNDTANRVALVAGVVEDPVTINLTAQISNSAGNVFATTGIGYDATTAVVDNITQVTNSNQYLVRASSVYHHFPAIGYHYYQALEYGSTTSTFSMMGLQALVRG